MSTKGKGKKKVSEIQMNGSDKTLEILRVSGNKLSAFPQKMCVFKGKIVENVFSILGFLVLF